MATIIASDGNKIKIEVEIDLTGSMLDMEDKILNACNEVGVVSTEAALKKFDTDGSDIVIGDTKYTVNKISNKDYETPYGRVSVKRHLYQTNKGGKTYIPLDIAARIIHSATPRFAKILSGKYAKMHGSAVLKDLEDSHNRHVSLQYTQDLSDIVSAIAQSKEETWKYHIPKIDANITSVAISLDGAHVGMKSAGYRETMAGTISLYDSNGERKHTIYIGASPEYGKEKFYQRLTNEIEHVKKLYPDPVYIGVADGAKSNWSFLEKHATNQILDFYHVTEYLNNAAEVMKNPIKRKEWIDNACHELKNTIGAPQKILNNMRSMQQSLSKKITKTARIHLQDAITYFTNNIENGVERMNYAKHTEKHFPIGSGVVEAACKTLIKHRCCYSGMRWTEAGLKVVLTLRALVQTKGRWSQFWKKIDQFGAPHLA